ncbi:MAG: T3SS (YopN, CesT) and YbjN peptide-binding chaperone 1 [Nocardioidaceae bacterium]
MSEFAGFDLDRSTERAWSRFQVKLADHLAEMRDDDVLIVSAQSAVDDEEEGAAPYVQFVGWGESMVRSEVSSNAYLAEEARLDAAAARMIAGLGWHEPTAGKDDDDPGEGSANFFLDLERSNADRLAVMTTRALRDVFGVAHPAFLTAGGLDEDAEPDLGIPSGQGPSEPEVEPPAVFPRDRDHLIELVDKALTPFFGSAPLHDEDDDIPVVNGSALVFVRVAEQMPAIQLFCCVVHDVTDEDSAAFEVAVLNRDQAFLKFVLVEDRVMAHLWVPAYPFAPEHLRAMLAVTSQTVDAVDDDLARRVRGRRTFEPGERAGGYDEQLSLEASDSGLDSGPDSGPDLGPNSGPDSAVDVDGEAGPDAIHPAMMTLLQLDAGAPGTLTPELVASVCAMNRELILELITWNSQQEISWRKARDRALLAADTDEAEVSEREVQHAEATVNLLRRALRLVVEQQLGRDLEDLGYSVARRRSPRGRRRGRDTALPGLDRQEPGLFDEP